VGIGAMVDLERLPELRTHTFARQVSSHDPTGGNDDGFYSVNFLYFDANRTEFVLLEETGSGCVYRIQMADLRSFFGPPVRIRIYLEGASVPTVDLPLSDFFSGKKTPFLAPLVGASHPHVGPGFGYYSYVPIPYRAGVRIALTGLVHFYNISYHTYRDGIGTVPLFGRDRAITEMVGLWQRVGSRPTPVRSGERTAYTAVNLGPNASQTLLDVVSTGVISGLELTPPDAVMSWPVDLNQVRIKIHWDNEPNPSVDVPLSLFFAVGDWTTTNTSLLLGATPGERLYCYFPMPFWNRARIVLENRSGRALVGRATVVYRTSTTPVYDPAKTGYLRCALHASDPVQPGEDYNALDVGGRGHVAGVVLEAAGKDFFHFENYLEGDDRIYVDFAKTPTVHGNGTEDFFNGAYYFLNQTFSRPQHGSPFHRVTPNESRRIAFRLFTGDVIPFLAHARLGFEVGGYSHLRSRYRSAVFYYHRPDRVLAYADGFSVGDAAEESAHKFTTNGGRVGPVQGAYEGDQDDVQITDGGVSLGAGKQCTFEVTIPAGNDGVILRRRLDYQNGGTEDQIARVEVNGRGVGTWTLRGHYLNHLAAFPNLPAQRGQGVANKRWRDSDFHIPASFTRNLNRLTIKLIDTATKGSFNAFDFRVYAHLSQAAADTQPPGAPSGLQAEAMSTDSVVLTWNAPGDDTGISHYEVWRSPRAAQPPTQVGRSFGTRFVDRHVDPSLSFYGYSVRAVDAAGNPGPSSPVVNGSPGRTLHYECEELLPASRSAGDTAGQLDLVLFPQLGRPWSGDNQVLFVGNSSGDWISFPIPVTVAGNYELQLAYTSFLGTTPFEVLLDNQPLGPPVYPPPRIERRVAVFKPRFFKAGVREIKIRLVESSSVFSGTQVVLDCLTLTPE